MTNHVKSMSHECFVCGKMSAIGFDFLVIESINIHTDTVRNSQDVSQERVCGIVRLTLCVECIKQGLAVLISSKTKKGGKPKLFQKETLASLHSSLEKVNRGIFENTPEMESVFISAFIFQYGLPVIKLGKRLFDMNYIPKDKTTQSVISLFKEHSSLPLSSIPEELQTPLMKRSVNRVIEPQYVLWSPDNDIFKHKISPLFDTKGQESNIIMLPISLFLSKTPAGNAIIEMYIGMKLRKQLPDFVMLYKNSLSKV